ncbi:DNA-binding protein [Methyloceanibacter methanicus]|uniref:DNA-binding protein n=1 Tax=Methyloceanibacter methanicus TaxID=1774968 RepID=A0A1E3W2N5_9HYPH|nr:helix-turn-helix transcriptional regulator [Methyloceanibacter methanicus]ODS00063.1 DNA-binding protein [Methyloceanibacter methanicus]
MKRLTHDRIWSAIDALADRYGLSVSGLAKRSGLDPTAFNKSKRATGDGRPRWPTTESIAKVLDATGATLEDFTTLATAEPGTAMRNVPIPLIELTRAGAGGFFDDGGCPVGSGWEQVRFPWVDDEKAYALEVTGDGMEPLYRAGDILIVSPNAPTQNGDRVVVRTTDGEVMAKLLVGRAATTIELGTLNCDQPNFVFPLDRVEWIARIIWASQ